MIEVQAKSFKEGRSYVTPLIMLVVFPAPMGAGGMEQNNLMALMPVFDVPQLIRQIFQGEFCV